MEQDGQNGSVNIWKAKAGRPEKACGEGKVVTTYLDMNSEGELCPKECGDERFEAREVIPSDWKFNRMMYELVGDPWEWWDKRSWEEKEWREYVAAPGLRTFGAYFAGEEAGYFELKKQEDQSVQIMYFGLAEKFIGRGLGGALLTRAILEGWRMGATRVWVHTCTKDHPAALKNYLARGMKIYKRV